MPPPTPGVAHLTPRVLRDRLRQGERLVILDVREDDERGICAIPVPSTALDLHIPMGLIPTSLEEIRASAESAPLIIYCHHGVRSMTVARWLAVRGVAEVHNLDGGIDAYSDLDQTIARY